MALGAGSVTPLQMATAYGVFANGGYRAADADHQRHRQQGQRAAQAQPPPLDESMRTLDARNAFVMNTLLQEVTRSGTAAKAKRALRRAATSSARPAPPTIRWTPGSPATSPAWSPWCGSATTRRASWATAKPAAAWRCRCGSSSWPHALKGVPVEELTPPEGVVQVDGDWIFDEFSQRPGVSSLGLEDELPQPPTSEERNSILDLFRR